jgi:flagellar hook-basal body complex protein FliE
MNVNLKPFDFAQAVARAGLQTNGQPLPKTKEVEGAGFSKR